MRIWLIGADMRGCEVLRQFRKNNNIEVIVSDSTERPRALVDKLIDKVNYVEPVTSVNINHLARRIRPDLILIDPGEAQRSMGRVSGGVAFTESLLNEMAAASDYPCLIL
jgi:carbamoylphosphate synthase large subunit